MKRLILLFCLLSGLASAQIVGGFLPISSTKSFTAGSGRFSGAVTTPSVIGNSTLSLAPSTSSAGISITNTLTTIQTPITINSNSLSTGLYIVGDNTGNQYPCIITSTTGSNSDLILQGVNNSRLTTKNLTTLSTWMMGNNTLTTTIGLDGFGIGQSTNHALDYFSIKSSTGFITMGASMATLNTTTLGGVTLNYNTSSGLMHFGKFNATSNAIWGYHSGTPTTSNYNINFDATNMYLNGPTNLVLVTANATRASINSTSLSINVPFYSSSRVIASQGADVASAVGTMTLGSDGNVFEITGTSAITLIPNTGYQNGAEITLLFTSTASLTDGTANSGVNIGFELAGNANFTGSADDLITLVLCEMGGTQRWREKCRSVN